jgi:hypothetical protein
MDHIDAGAERRVKPLAIPQMVIGPVDAGRAHALAPTRLIGVIAALGANLADCASLGTVFDQHLEAGGGENLLAGRLPVRA